MFKPRLTVLKRRTKLSRDRLSRCVKVVVSSDPVEGRTHLRSSSDLTCGTPLWETAEVKKPVNLELKKFRILLL